MAVALSFALSTPLMTYPLFDWLDNLRDRLSAPIMGKVIKDQDKNVQKPQGLNRQTSKLNGRNGVKQHAAKQAVRQPETATVNKKSPKPVTPISLSIAQMLTKSYLAEGIETPINRIGANAVIETGYDWFGRKISSRKAIPKLVKGVLASSVMFAVHNMAAFFLYPDYLKNCWWMKGFADSFCTSMVMGAASTLFGTDKA